MAEVRNVCVRVGYGEAERRELGETNDVAIFLRDRGTDGTRSEPGADAVVG